MRELRQARALATRRRILRAAAQSYAEKGYNDTKLEELLKRARVTMGAFFHHFESKEDLAFAVIDDHMRRWRRQLDQRERRMTAGDDPDPLQRVFWRLDAYAALASVSRGRKGGCIIGNLSASLSDTHNGFRRRLAECFDEMAADFKPPLDAAAKRHCPRRRLDTWALARYIVTVIEGSILLARTHRDRRMMGCHFAYLKAYFSRRSEWPDDCHSVHDSDGVCRIRARRGRDRSFP